MNKLVALFVLTFGGLASAQQYEAWRLTERIDRITDENTSVIIARAQEYPQYADISGVVIRCSDSEWDSTGVEVYFNADRYLGSADYFSVIYRVDRGEPVSGRWGASTDGEAVFTPDSQIPGFLRLLKDASELVFRITAFSTDYTYAARVSGLNDALFALGCYKGPPL